MNPSLTVSDDSVRDYLCQCKYLIIVFRYPEHLSLCLYVEYF